jgi:hypothetical protein
MSRYRYRGVGVPAVALAAILGLAGCSGSAVARLAAEDAVELSAAPATGPTISGTGYSFALPEGWTVPAPESLPEDLEAPGMEILAADMADADGFTDNLNVVLASGGVFTADQIESVGVRELEAGGIDDVEVQDRVMIVGTESAHLSAAFGTTHNMDQYYVSNDEQTYIVTFSFSPTVSVPDRDALAQSVLASWAWI